MKAFIFKKINKISIIICTIFLLIIRFSLCDRCVVPTDFSLEGSESTNYGTTEVQGALINGIHTGIYFNGEDTTYRDFETTVI